MSEDFARELDKFYTKSQVAALCTDMLYARTEEFSWPLPSLSVEPSAGAGAFLRLIKGPKIGIDIAPEGDDIIKHDFMTWAPPAISPVWVIGNPPFGKNSALAMRFFNRAAEFADLIAFVLPRTFQKPKFNDRVSRKMHLFDELVLPRNSFTLDGKELDVPAVFQIWLRRADDRLRYEASLLHEDFSFVPLSMADFAVQRVGVKAGAVKRDPEHRSAQSHYGIKAAAGIDADHLKSVFEKLNYGSVKHHTAGNPSIGKAELIALYEAHHPQHNQS